MKFRVTLSVCLLFAFLSKGAEDKSLKLRVQAYVEAMMNGERTSLLRVKDYYGRVYLTKKATVKNINQQDGGIYNAEIQFETIGWVEQNAEVAPITRSEVKKSGTVMRTISFRLKAHTLQMLVPLETPFVRAGSEKRYLLEKPQSP